MKRLRTLLSPFGHTFQRRSIFVKLSLHILAAIIPLVALVLYSNVRSAQIIYEQTGSSVERTLRQAGMRIQDLKRSLEDTAAAIREDPEIRRTIELQPTDNGVDPRPVLIQSQLLPIQEASRNIRSIHVFVPRAATLYSSASVEAVHLSYFDTYRFYRLARIYRDDGAWFQNDLTAEESIQELYRSPGVSFTRLMEATSIGGIGAEPVITINATGDAFTRILRDVRTQTFEDIALIVPNSFHFSLLGRISPDGELYDAVSDKTATDTTGFFRRTIDGHEKIVYFYQIEPDWYLIARAPLQATLGESRLINILTLLIALLIVLFSLFTTRELYRHLYIPIRKLVDNMERVQAGDLKTRIRDTRDDEFGVSYRIFNSMTERLNQLGERVYAAGQRRREAEVMLLQSQINPHFLYNTLDTIYWMAEQYDVSEISELAFWLGRFYRLSLNSGAETVQIQTVQEQLESYLGIHKVRFPGKISYDIHVDEAVRSMEIPTLLVQPIVENAIYHGLQRTRTQGRIVVNFANRSDVLLIRVCDNGPGIDRETLRQIRDDLKSEEFNGAHSYGIKNVHERVRLKYGDDYGLTICSRPSQANGRQSGTIVRIRIPCEKS